MDGRGSAARSSSVVCVDGTGDAPEELRRALRRTVSRALAEDLGPFGDVTSTATIRDERLGAALITARQTGIVAGLGAVVETFAQLDDRVEVEPRVADGDEVEPGDVVARVDGPLRAVLSGERTALNLLCHLSGVATTTSVYVAVVAQHGCAIRDTRKTRPGLRSLEKEAVRVGGGENHRMGLHDALLVKDNHIAAGGGVAAATRAALQGAGGRHVQVEVTSHEEAREAVAAGATDLLLDNLDPDRIRPIVDELGSDVRLEASGRITLRHLNEYAATGVDAISVGVITHGAPWLDLGLDLVPGDGDPASRVHEDAEA